MTLNISLDVSVLEYYLYFLCGLRQHHFDLDRYYCREPIFHQVMQIGDYQIYNRFMIALLHFHLINMVLTKDL